MSVMSLRLGKEEKDIITRLSKQKKEAKSKVVRELLRDGWVFYWLKPYSEKKVSIGRMAEELDLSINEALDLLADFGIGSSRTYDDYLQGFENLSGQK
jgi:predicted HTH domain antitoxin